jgi:hypothetical protein
VDAYHARITARVGTDVEPLVKSGAQNLLEAVSDLKDPIRNDAVSASAAVDVTNPVPLPCTTNRNY